MGLQSVLRTQGRIRSQNFRQPAHTRPRKIGVSLHQVEIDEARLGIMLNELRLPTIKSLWPQFAEQADQEGWPAARFLCAIAEHELAERAHRRVERHLSEAHLPPGKTLDSFAFDAVPMVSKAQVMAMAAGDSTG